MVATVTWEREPEPGWTEAYRLVAAFAWLPTRIDGRWHWRVAHYALQVMYVDESPPSPWLTIRRAFDPEPLLHWERDRYEGRH